MLIDDVLGAGGAKGRLARCALAGALVLGAAGGGRAGQRPGYRRGLGGLEAERAFVRPHRAGARALPPDYHLRKRPAPERPCRRRENLGADGPAHHREVVRVAVRQHQL